MKLMMRELMHMEMLQWAQLFICCNHLVSIEFLLEAHEVVSDEDDELVVRLTSC